MAGGADIFGLLVSGLAAVNQLVWFLVALFCSLLGAALVGNAIYWRLHAVRVQGELIGLRQSGKVYRSVYRYALPSGQSVEASSNQGSSSLSGRDTGSSVALQVIPEHPNEVQEARSHVWTLLGMLFLGVGVWLFCLALTRFPVGPMTWAVAALFVIFLARKLTRILLPKDKRLTISAWRSAVVQRRIIAGAGGPVQRVEDLRQLPENLAQASRQRQQQRRAGPFLLFGGLTVMLLALIPARHILDLQANGLRAQGVVESLQRGDGGSNSSYFPLVRFTTRDGALVRFRDASGSDPPAYRVDDRVAVLYAANDTGRAIIDGGPWNWLPVALMIAFGAVLCIAGVRLRQPATV